MVVVEDAVLFRENMRNAQTKSRLLDTHDSQLSLTIHISDNFAIGR